MELVDVDKKYTKEEAYSFIAKRFGLSLVNARNSKLTKFGYINQNLARNFDHKLYIPISNVHDI